MSESQSEMDYLQDVVLKSLYETAAELLPIGSLEGIHEYRRQLTLETDRGCALAAAAFLDSELETLLRRYLVDDSSVVQRLFDGNGSFSTFSTKIDSAYSLGLLTKHSMLGIHLVRKIRNEFAHKLSQTEFVSGRVKDWCRLLEPYSLLGTVGNERRLFESSTMFFLAELRSTASKISGHRPELQLNYSKALREQVRQAIDEMLKFVPTETEPT
ncbi:MAG: hypothetical protein U0X20_12340 [Caldilineaceae bacterium]